MYPTMALATVLVAPRAPAPCWVLHVARDMCHDCDAECHLVQRGGQQGVEECPEGAGVAPPLGAAARAPAPPPLDRGVRPGLVHCSQLLHLCGGDKL